MLKNMKNVEKIGGGLDFFVDMMYHLYYIELKGSLCNNKQLIRWIERCK